MFVCLGRCSGMRWYSSVPGLFRVSVLLRDKPVDQTVNVKGWVKGIRRHKERTFVMLDDGSCFTKLQVVLSKGQRTPSLLYHSALSVTGLLQRSPHKGQEVELVAENVQVIGSDIREDYPFKARQIHSPDYIRSYPHLRPRTNSFASTLRVRSQMKMAIHDYFEREGFINIDTPILTTNDCEGGGEVFNIQPSDMKDKQMTAKAKNEGDARLNGDAETTKTSDLYFGQPAHLTVSGQLHLEAMINGLSKVYNFNPAFRAENALSRRHLSEFWMVEAEEAFLEGGGGMEMLLGRVEGLVKDVVREVVEGRGREDVQAHWAQNQGAEERVRKALDHPFPRIPYSEAVSIVNKASQDLLPVPPGDLGREHELYLTSTFGNAPVFVTDWPLESKPFYMSASDDDPTLALALDLLLPDIGEVVGGGLREHRLSSLTARLPPSSRPPDQPHPLDWYLDLRALGGGVPSGGFGLGVERLLQFVLGVANIKDTIPFPRWSRHCPG